MSKPLAVSLNLTTNHNAVHTLGFACPTSLTNKREQHVLVLDELQPSAYFLEQSLTHFRQEQSVNSRKTNGKTRQQRKGYCMRTFYAFIIICIKQNNLLQ